MGDDAQRGRKWEEAAGEEYHRSRQVYLPQGIEALTDACIGGSTESQREFLQSLSGEEGRKAQDKQSSKHPPIANSFALGYTYHDVLDADHEGMLLAVIHFLTLLIYIMLQISLLAFPYTSSRTLRPPSPPYFNPS